MRYLDHSKEVFNSLTFFFDIKAIAAILFGAYGYLFGFDSNAAMAALVGLLVFDLFTGTLAAYARKDISSREAAKTPLKFGIYLMLVSAAHLADEAVFSGFYIQETMIAFLALTELISILENAGKLGIAIPKQLMKRLKVLRDEK